MEYCIPVFNRKYIFKGSVFHCYVSLPQCTSCSALQLNAEPRLCKAKVHWNSFGPKIFDCILMEWCFKDLHSISQRVWSRKSSKCPQPPLWEVAIVGRIPHSTQWVIRDSVITTRGTLTNIYVFCENFVFVWLESWEGEYSTSQHH